MRPALEVADIFRRHGATYRADQAGHLTVGQRRVMLAIEACRTAVLGGHVERCQDCGETRIAYNSCRNRHCPKCQGLTRAQWLADRQAELLPVPYFHLVFTVPAAIACIALQNKAVVYDILFRASAETVHTIAADPKHLGAAIGMTAVLHTWGQNLFHHPHIHCIVPGGGVSAEGRWIACRPGFFLSVRVLSRLYRRLFLKRLRAAFDAGLLSFFGELAELAKPATFRQETPTSADPNPLRQETPTSADPNPLRQKTPTSADPYREAVSFNQHSARSSSLKSTVGMSETWRCGDSRTSRSR